MAKIRFERLRLARNLYLAIPDDDFILLKEVLLLSVYQQDMDMDMRSRCLNFYGILNFHAEFIEPPSEDIMNYLYRREGLTGEGNSIYLSYDKMLVPATLKSITRDIHTSEVLSSAGDSFSSLDRFSTSVIIEIHFDENYECEAIELFVPEKVILKKITRFELMILE